MVSDNVFIATVFINEVEQLFSQGEFAREWFEQLAVAISVGTNIPAMGTPNGHAALLFLLTSSIASLINLSYLEMLKLALPYTIVLTTMGAACLYFLM